VRNLWRAHVFPREIAPFETPTFSTKVGASNCRRVPAHGDMLERRRSFFLDFCG
jgi:hypothetical protein